MRFAEPIGSMRVGSDQIGAVVSASIAHVEADPRVQRQFCLAAAAAAGVRLQVAAGAAATDAASGPCATAWREAKDEERVTSAAMWTRHETVLALTGYVRALEALMSAADGAPLAEAEAALAQAVALLDEAAARLPGNGRLPAAASPISRLEPLLAGFSADFARFAVLEGAVAAANPVIGRMVALIAADVEVAHAVRIGRAPIEYERASLASAIVPVSAERGFAAFALPDAVADFRASDPADAVRRLGTAHAALLRAIESGTGKSFIELTFAVDQFAEAAREVWQVYGAYSAALNGAG